MKGIKTIMVCIFAVSLTSFSTSNSTLETPLESSINFQNLTLQKALNLAKKQHKKVFINVYATWCGPCKMMMAKTYTNATVGSYFNQNFVNINLDVEHNPEGMAIAKRYKVMAHPCLLFLNPDGSLAGKIMGYYQGESLLAMVKQNVRK